MQSTSAIHLPAASLLALTLVACAGGPDLVTGPGANPSAARGLLVSTAAEGPVPLEIDSVPRAYTGGVGEVARIASRGGSWLGASFVPVPYAQSPERRRLVLRFEEPSDSPAAICAGTAPTGSLPPEPARLHAVFCDGQRPVADVTGTAEGTDQAAVDRLVTASIDRLFPGRGGDTYYGGPGISLGVGIGSDGDWGLGGGLHF